MFRRGLLSLFKTSMIHQRLIKGDGRARGTVFRRFVVSLFKTGVIQQLMLTKGDGRTRVTAVVDETGRNTVATHMIQDKGTQQEEG